MGLVAKGNSNFNDDFNYPDRTYLFNGASEDQIFDFMLYKAKHEVSNTYCICKVNGKILKSSSLQHTGRCSKAWQARRSLSARSTSALTSRWTISI